MRHAWYRVEFFISGLYQGEVRVFATNRNEAWLAATNSKLYESLTRDLSRTRARNKSMLRWLITIVPAKEVR
jgi:hypothetical protein